MRKKFILDWKKILRKKICIKFYIKNKNKIIINVKLDI